MSAAFIKATAANAASAEDMAADAANRFLSQALPLWRSTRAHGNRQARQAASAIQSALDALGASIEQCRTARAPLDRSGSS